MFLDIIIIVSFITLYHTMANLETWSQSTDLFETAGARKLNEQEIQTMFDDDFFDDLESDDPLKKIYMQEINDKVFFEKPDNVNFGNPESSYTKSRLVWQNNVFVDRFFISKEDWENIKNRRDNLNWAIETTQTETQQLNDEVTQTATPETMWSSIEARTDKLLDRFDKFNDHWPQPKRPWESRRTLERLKAVVRNDIAYLKSIKKELQRYTYTWNPEIFEADLDELERQQLILEDVRQRITRWDDTSDIPTILWSLRDVKRADRFENKMAKYNQKVNEILKDAAMKELWNKDMEWFQDYLEDVWSGEIEHPAEHPFYRQYEKDFAYIRDNNPMLYVTVTTCQNPKRKKWWQQWESYNWSYVVVCPWQPKKQCEKKPWVFDKGGEMFSDLLVTAWVIDENNTAQKEAWSKFWKVALLWLWAFAVYKMIKEKDWKRWAWIGWTAAVLLGMANKDGLYKWYNDAFWKSNPSSNEIITQMNTQAGVDRTTSVEVQEIIDNLIDPTSTVIWAIWWININTLISEDIVSADNDWKFEFNYDKYKVYVENNVTDSDEKILNLQAGERLKKDPSMLHKWLQGLWVSNMDILQALWQENDRLMDTDLVWNYLEYVDSPMMANLYEQGFKPKDTESRYKIMSLSNWKHNISNYDMVTYISEGLVVLRDESLTRYLNSNIIDLTNKCMKWCDIKFSTYGELLKAVELTEWIINEFKDKPARDDQPFHLWMWLTWNIEYNNGIINDTDVINSNIFKDTLEKISPNLAKNKHAYVKYLNALWKAAQ